MSLIEGIIGPIASLIDKIIPDPKARLVQHVKMPRHHRTNPRHNLSTATSSPTTSEGPDRYQQRKFFGSSRTFLSISCLQSFT